MKSAENNYYFILTRNRLPAQKASHPRREPENTGEHGADFRWALRNPLSPRLLDLGQGQTATERDRWRLAGEILVGKPQSSPGFLTLWTQPSINIKSLHSRPQASAEALKHCGTSWVCPLHPLQFLGALPRTPPAMVRLCCWQED